MLQTLVVGKNQSIDRALRSPKNKPFVRKFMSRLTPEERGTLMRGDGSLNRMGIWRIKGAIFSKIFPGEAGERLADSMLESLDSNVKNFENSIGRVMPKLAQAEGMFKAGRRPMKFSLAGDIAKAIDMLARLRDGGIGVTDYLGQRSLWKMELNAVQRRLLRHFGMIGKSPVAIRAFLNNYANFIIAKEVLPIGAPAYATA
jgi:hypothetical protein